MRDGLRDRVTRRGTWVPAAMLCLAAAASSARAVAQTAPGQAPSGQAPSGKGAAPSVEMPRALTPLTAAYPEGATGDAVVLLKLVIDKDGSVSGAEVVVGAEPFLTAALAAAKSFKFLPAKRDGTPIRAAVRVEVTFTAPVPVPATPPADSAPANSQSPDKLSPNSQSPDKPSPNSQSSTSQSGKGAGASGAPSGASVSQGASPALPEPEPIDVSVRGDVAPPGGTTMSRAEVRLLPGAFGDPFRAVETLPGVTPIATGLPYFFVRGAPPGNVGYYLDGVRVPLLYHLGLGPSVVNPGMVDRVDLYPGGYPARFGRFAGAIVSGETRGPRPEVNGEAQLRLVDAGALVEVPFDEGRGAALAGGRYSYTGLLFSLLQSDLRLDYWDYQARVSYDLTPRDTVSVFAFGARDFLGDTDEGKDRTLVDTTFHRVDLRYRRALGPGSHYQQGLTLGFDQTAFEGGATRDLLFATRGELTYLATPRATFRAGFDASTDEIDTSLAGSDIGRRVPIALSDRFDVNAGVWADAVFQVTDRLEVTPGLRVDAYGSTGAGGGNAVSVEPRLSSLLRVRPWLRLVQAYGVVAQRPSFFVPGPGFSPDFQDGLQRAFQASAGVEADLPLDLEAKVTLFRSAFFDMTDAFGTSTFDDIASATNPDARSLGSATGVEVSLRRRMTKRVGGFLSYTLSHSDRALGATRLPAGTNRTHVLNLALGVDIGRGFRAGTKVVFYTGVPEILEVPGTGERVFKGRVLPPFFRVDGRLEKKWTLGGSKWLSLVLEMQNATLSVETLRIVCDGTCEALTIGPVAIPSIGLEGGL